VIHEFAHQLDQERGRANGAPWLGWRDEGPPTSRHHAGRNAGQAYARWAQVLGAEFEALRQRLARGEPGVIDAYAATDPAEFFAVVSEHFFEQPAALAAAHPALYGEFSRLYRCNPLVW
jgi:MtfA peptidase